LEQDSDIHASPNTAQRLRGAGARALAQAAQRAAELAKELRDEPTAGALDDQRTRIQRAVEPRSFSPISCATISAHGRTSVASIGVCGACTILWNGEPVRSCLLFRYSMNGADLKTVEGSRRTNALHPLQEKFWNCTPQCGFCTPESAHRKHY